MRIAGFLAASLILVACGDDDSDDAPPAIDAGPQASCDDSQAAAAPAFDPIPELGLTSLQVRARRGADGSLVGTTLYATLVSEPLPNPYTAGLVDGACRQWLEPGFNCGLGECGPTQICVAQNVCQDYPPGASAGDLVVDGVTVEEGDAAGLYFSELPAGEACAGVVLTAGKLTRTVKRPPPLLGAFPDNGYRLSEGEPLRIEWIPADAGSRVRLTLRADRGAHGALWSSIIECDVPDSAGAIVVPAALVDRHLAELSCGECPESSLTRYRRSDDAEVELLVVDEIGLFITHFSGGSE